MLQLKQCGIEKKYDHLIFSILSNLGSEFYVFISTFHSSKLTAKNWRMHVLVDFMESVTQEKDKLVKMGTIKTTKDKAIIFGVSNQSKYKKKVNHL